MLDSVLLERMQFMRLAGITFGNKRDTYEVLGYARTLTTKDYHDRYARGGIAGRVVDALPKAAWRSDMWLEENDNPDKLTTLEQQWEDLDQQFDLQTLLLRVDILAQLSSYAVLLIGAPGDESLDTELPKGQPGSLIYLTPFSGGGGPTNSGRNPISNMDGDALIKEYDSDIRSKRFGLPLFYQLRRLDISTPELQQPVHWSRVLHVPAEGCLDNEVFGSPSMERVWNLLDDLDKITGGGGEAAWLNANRGLHLDVDKDIKDMSAEERTALQQQAEEYQHQVRRMLRTRGVKVSSLGTDVAQFGPNADAILTQIAGAKSIPKRILTGSEMGELASSQDRDNWRDQIVGRQEGYTSKYLVRALAGRLMDYGYLAKSKNYVVRWSPINTRTEDEKANGAQRWAAVNKTQGEVVFTNDEIRDYWYGKQPLDDAEKKMPAPPVPDQPAFPRAAEEHDDELVRVLEDALIAGNRTIVDRIIGLGGPGSGNFGHEGRPGEIGGSLPHVGPSNISPKGGLSISSHPPSQLPTAIDNWLAHKGRVPLTSTQIQKVHQALHKVNKLLSDPEISGPLFEILSSATPLSLKQRLDSFHAHGYTDLPKATEAIEVRRAAADPRVESALATIYTLMLDPEIGTTVQALVLDLVQGRL